MNSTRTLVGVSRRRALASTLALAAIASGFTLTSGSVARASGTGSVDVLYAGSLLNLMTTQIAPAFHRATGYSVSGIANGSSALASEIKGGTQVADVLLSASPSVDRTLEGAKNGNWISSYRTIGRSSLVLGYNRASSFAAALRTSPWYEVVGRAGFLLGRTDPLTDPKGVLAVTALRGAATRHHRPHLAALATSKSNVFTETSLVGELDAGQLDAGFFYAVEASAAHLATVPLTGTNLAGTYTVALVNRAPHRAAARAFISFLFSSRGRQILERNGITPAVPASASTTNSP